jgi:repressor LexA
MIVSRDKLSDKQIRILEFIESYLDENQIPPSIRDIQVACELSSTSVVQYNMRNLEKFGFISRRVDVARGIQIIRNETSPTENISHNILYIPLIGRIAAGIPIPVTPQEAEAEDMLPFSRSQLGSKSDRALFALRVQGESMIDDGIFDGDIVVIEPRQTADPGEMVVAWIKSREETTLKRWYPEGERVRLQPRNSSMPPIYEDATDVEVQGRFVLSMNSG